MDKQKIFITIKSFVSEINNTYGSQYKHLAMYGRLLEKTNITHEIPINKHIAAFKKFVIANRNAILNKDYTLIKLQKIKYSENVYFNIMNIFKIASDDSDAIDIIWEHLLVLSAMLDVNSNAKQKLQSELSSTTTNQNGLGDMSTMLLPLMNMFTNSLVNPSENSNSQKPANNPLEALLGGSEGTSNLNNVFSEIINSGILPKMMNTFSNCMDENNQIDFKKLLNSVQDLVKDLNINIPTDVNKDSAKDIDNLLGAFESVGLDKNVMSSMVDTMVSSVKEVSKTDDTEPTIDITDVSEPTTVGDDVQVCYIGGDCC